MWDGDEAEGMLLECSGVILEFEPQSGKVVVCGRGCRGRRSFREVSPPVSCRQPSRRIVTGRLRKFNDSNENPAGGLAARPAPARRPIRLVSTVPSAAACRVLPDLSREQVPAARSAVEVFQWPGELGGCCSRAASRPRTRRTMKPESGNNTRPTR
jgi:hypothetical protein